MESSPFPDCKRLQKYYFHYKLRVKICQIKFASSIDLGMKYVDLLCAQLSAVGAGADLARVDRDVLLFALHVNKACSKIRV
jgi:hypothetical protein